MHYLTAVISPWHFGVVAAMLCAFVAGVHFNHRVLVRARDTGHRYWMVNPLALWTGLKSRDFVWYLVSGVVSIGCALFLMHAYGLSLEGLVAALRGD